MITVPADFDPSAVVAALGGTWEEEPAPAAPAAPAASAPTTATAEMAKAIAETISASLADQFERLAGLLSKRHRHHSHKHAKAESKDEVCFFI